MKVLELYSGIGGMHLALVASQVPGEIVASVDINTVANAVYKHNFPTTELLNRNVQGLTPKFVNSLGADTILMSPPCQPFTRNGSRKDKADPRTDSFVYLLEILPELNVDKILVENVKGFESSEMHEDFLRALRRASFGYREFLLSPTQIGVPNTRQRYYCLARKNVGLRCVELSHDFPITSTINEEPSEISTVLEIIDSKDYNIPENVLKKRCKVLDICHPDSRRSCCFTKAYGRYVEGTGSVLAPCSSKSVTEAYAKFEEAPDSPDAFEGIKKLNLRFFTPKEVCRLMCFPEEFRFPDGLKDRQKYMLLGNSINVKVVAELIKMLNEDSFWL